MPSFTYKYFSVHSSIRKEAKNRENEHNKAREIESNKLAILVPSSISGVVWG